MDNLLNPVSTKAISKDLDGSSSNPRPSHHSQEVIPRATSPESALYVLTSQPSTPALSQTLNYLSFTASISQVDGFNILLPTPRTAQIVFALVNDIVPSFWPTIKAADSADERLARKHLLRCLCSAPGLGALVATVKAEHDAIRIDGKAKGKGERLVVLVEVLEELLKGDGVLLRICNDLSRYETRPGREEMVWKEVTSLVAGGRLISVVAEGELLLREQSERVGGCSWVGDGRRFAKWLGRNLRRMIERLSPKEWEETGRKAMVRCLNKALSLGYSGTCVSCAI